MGWTLQVTDNVLPEVLQEVRAAAVDTLTVAGDVFRYVAQNEAPISYKSGKNYVHMVETINYDVDTDSALHQAWVTFFVLPFYSQFVNFGTSRMPPRPFFTNGVLAVQNGYDLIAYRCFAGLMSGRRPGLGEGRGKANA